MLECDLVTSEATNLIKFSELTPGELNDSIEKAVCVAKRLIDSHTWRGTQGGNLPDGSDARDLVHDVIEGLLNGTNSWVDSINFETFLIQTVKGNISNLVRKKENKVTSVIADIIDDEQNMAPSSSKSPFDTIGEQEFENLLLELLCALDDKPHEQKCVEAIIIKGALERRDIIAHSGLSPKDYDNANKRLKRFLSSDVWQKKRTFHHK